MEMAIASGLSPQSAGVIAELGARFDPTVLRTTRALFEGKWDLSLPPQSRKLIDLAYDTSARQTLDLYTSGQKRSPVLIYVPGGGFTGGDKSGYAHIGAAFARRGFTTAVMNYRLAPDDPWPAGARDVAGAIDWLVGNVAAHGGDAARIFVLAQSAGATHSAGAIFDPRFRPRHHRAIQAALLMSGLHRMEPQLTAPNVRAYFGDDPDAYPDRSPVNHVVGSATKIALSVAEFDPSFLSVPTFALATALSERDGKPPRLAWLKSHNHVSPVLALGTQENHLDQLFSQILLEREDAVGAID
jgi:acetyl esterase/lipase